jgi:hypothetical protein
MGAKQILDVTRSLHPTLDSDTVYGNIDCMNPTSITDFLAQEELGLTANPHRSHCARLIEDWQTRMGSLGRGYYLYSPSSRVLNGFFPHCGVIIWVSMQVLHPGEKPFSFPPDSRLYTVKRLRVETARERWRILSGVSDCVQFLDDPSDAEVGGEMTSMICKGLALLLRRDWIRDNTRWAIQTDNLSWNPVAGFASEAQ